MLYAVVMAGGSGTRFWPESRAARPKQLLALLGQQTMIQATVERLGDLVPLERVFIATTAALAPAIAEQLGQLPRESILVEPCRRDTAPCIGLAALRMLRDDPDATMVVLPSDQVIEEQELFRDTIRFGASLLEQHPDRIVTFGVRPTYAAESFGYIERGDLLAPAGADHPAAYRVALFHEKPKADVAQRYVAEGKFYWNSGIFVWRAQTILDSLAQHAPETYERLQRIAAAADRDDFAEVLQREFSAIRPVSIDFAVMEHAKDVAVVEAPFPWDDVGSWRAIARLRGADAQGNTISGRHLGIDTQGTIVRTSDDHLIVTVGLRDCIVVHTPDATLVAAKEAEESIRQVVKALEQQRAKEV